jgi:uncharacterized protein (DUF302 family)
LAKINIKREVVGSVEEVVQKITESLASEGFGILTRIDFHTKIKEKLNKNIGPTVILGSCNPALALEAFQYNSDVASLLPCNAVIREIAQNKVSVELVKPTALMKILDDEELVKLSEDADLRLQRALDALE